MEKHFVTEQEHILDGFRLGCKIFDSSFRPSFIVGLWRGGSAVGIVVQECLATLGVETDHIALRTSYTGREEYERTVLNKSAIRVHGKQYLLDNLSADDQLLIVDDVYSSGRHTAAVIDSLKVRLKRNTPKEIRIASVWVRKPIQESLTPDGSFFSQQESQQDPQQEEHEQELRTQPDFFVHESSDWLVLPYELRGLTDAEIATHKPFLVPHLERC